MLTPLHHVSTSFCANIGLTKYYSRVFRTCSKTLDLFDIQAIQYTHALSIKITHTSCKPQATVKL